LPWPDAHEAGALALPRELSLALYHRYQFKRKENWPELKLLKEGDEQWAKLVGAATNLAYHLSGSIAGNLPGGPINMIHEDPDNPNVLYVSNDFGVYVTTNGGAKWEVLGGNLPSVNVMDFVIHPRDRMLIIATHGRGAWVIDVSQFKGK